MLKVFEPVITPHRLTVTNTVWRWMGNSNDPRGTIVVVMCAYPDIETASAATGPDAAPPLIEERYSITGNDFLALAAQLESPTGAGKPYSQCVYDHFRAKVPRFANAVDVDPIGG